MKIAILILCHKNPVQINQFIDILSCSDIDFYIHVDKKSKIINEIVSKPNVFFVPNEKRIDVRWGTFSQVQAELSLLEAAYNKKYDYFWLVSGQDYPLASSKKIIETLQRSPQSNYMSLYNSSNYGGLGRTSYDKRHEVLFPEWILKKKPIYRIIRRSWVELTGGYKRTYKVFKRRDSLEHMYYYGPQWWCINRPFVEYLQYYIDSTPNFLDCFKRTSCPDESFFQTILMNSSYSKDRKEYLHFIVWDNKKNSPRVLSNRDLDKAFGSNKLMARKIDIRQNKDIIYEMNKRIKTYS